MSKQQHLKKYDVTLIYENTTIGDVKERQSNLPTDIHVITYKSDDEVKYDAVRSQKMSDIFDGYYDYGVKDIQSIQSGFGTLNPKLYNPPTPEDS